MERRILAGSGIEVSRLGLATAIFAGGDRERVHAAVSSNISRRIVDEAIAAGVNLIEVAPWYAWGYVEDLLKKILREHEGEIHVLGRCGIHRDLHRRVRKSLRQADLIRQCEDSLRRLGIEAFAFYALPPEGTPSELEEGYLTLLKLQQQGKIRCPLVDSVSPELHAQLGSYGGAPGVLLPSNYLHWKALSSSKYLAEKSKVSVLGYEVLAHGILGNETSILEVEDTSENKPLWRMERAFDTIEKSRLASLLKTLQSLAKEYQRSLAQVSIDWSLRKGFDSLFLSVRTLEQLQELLLCGVVPMVEELGHSVEQHLKKEFSDGPETD